MRSLKWPAAPDVSLASSLVLKSSSPIKPPKTPPTTTPTGPAGEQPGDASAATATGGASASLPHPKTGSGSPTTSGVFIPPAVNPGIIVLNREGIVLVKYDRDLVALFSLSGRLLRFSRHRDLIHVRTRYSCSYSVTTHKYSTECNKPSFLIYLTEFTSILVCIVFILKSIINLFLEHTRLRQCCVFFNWIMKLHCCLSIFEHAYSYFFLSFFRRQ